jgi:hypothetical protein
MEFARALDQVILKHLDELKKPGVLSVRPGYQVAGGWPTKKPAIVVTVDRKLDDLPPRLDIPALRRLSMDFPSMSVRPARSNDYARPIRHCMRASLLPSVRNSSDRLFPTSATFPARASHPSQLPSRLCVGQASSSCDMSHPMARHSGRLPTR